MYLHKHTRGVWCMMWVKVQHECRNRKISYPYHIYPNRFVWLKLNECTVVVLCVFKSKKNVSSVISTIRPGKPKQSRVTFRHVGGPQDKVDAHRADFFNVQLDKDWFLDSGGPIFFNFSNRILTSCLTYIPSLWLTIHTTVLSSQRVLSQLLLS